MKYLFMGGPADGQWLDVQIGEDARPVEFWAFAEMQVPDIQLRASDELYTEDSIPVVKHLYHRHPIRDGIFTYYVYVPIKARCLSVMNKLLQHYKP